MKTATLLPLPLLLLACSAEDRQEAAGASEAMSAQVSNGTVATAAGDLADEASRLPGDERLAGRWTGPEGLTADIRPLGDGRYRVAMRYTLDDRGTFEAVRVGDTLVMQRPDGQVSLSYGAGAETGMKHIPPGAHCLIAKLGSEAYCRA